MLAAKNIDIGNAFNVLEIMSREENKRMAYEARQAELMDQRTRMMEAREEGREEGQNEKQSELIHNILVSGLPPEQVATITKVPLNQVLEVQRTMVNTA